jgi:hypothetical protein
VRAIGRRRLLGLAAVAATALAEGSAPDPATTDLIVYGATVAGLMAAIQARRMGRTALVLEPGTHIGGMTTGGLGYTDIGAPDSVGGLAAEFYRRVAKSYPPAGGGPRYAFAPSVASAVLKRMLAEAGVPVRTGFRLATVDRQGERIVALVAEDGRVCQGRMFVDAGYEGDLMAAAGVSWTTGREGNAEYGERFNGVRLRALLPGETVVDPYVAPGRRASGLLPGISAKPLDPHGSGDRLVQAYAYRMCITRAADRIPFPKPDGYDPAAYELLRRYIERGARAPFFSAYPVGDGKADSNNLGPYSTDFVGQSHAYPTADRRQRESIADAHRTYQQGLVWFLANDPRVPAGIRAQTSAWGLAADEFTGTGGWPPQLYVREARRMLADYVMTEHDCRGDRTAPDSIGLASYTMDSHSTRRVVLGGQVRDEGWLQVEPPGPYPVSYRSIVPRAAECANLLVPVCLAASHSGYGSIRMEPFFMILGQSAGAAAVHAIEARSAVQRIDYPALRARLVADGQVLDWPPLPAGDVVVDNANYNGVARTGKWSIAAGASGYFGADFADNDGGGTFRFTPKLPRAGRYTVYLRWTAAPNRARAVPVDVVHRGGTTTRTVDQRADGGEWVSLGVFPFAAGATGSVLIRHGNAGGLVIADAVRFVPA